VKPESFSKKIAVIWDLEQNSAMWKLATTAIGFGLVLLAVRGRSGVKTGYLFLGGRRVPVPFEVVNETGKLRFDARTERVVAGIIHASITKTWQKTMQVLLQAGNSTHFEVDPNGAVIQYGDPTTQAARHARDDNKYTIGIDLTGPISDIGGFTEAQLDSLADLVKILSAYFQIPLLTKPYDDFGVHAGTPGWWAHRQVQWEPGIAKSDPSWPYGSASVWDNEIRPRLSA
jgi:hypothetical protein